jgi:hypothetical protein
VENTSAMEKDCSHWEVAAVAAVVEAVASPFPPLRALDLAGRPLLLRIRLAVLGGVDERGGKEPAVQGVPPAVIRARDDRVAAVLHHELVAVVAATCEWSEGAGGGGNRREAQGSIRERREATGRQEANVVEADMWWKRRTGSEVKRAVRVRLGSGFMMQPYVLKPTENALIIADDEERLAPDLSRDGVAGVADGVLEADAGPALGEEGFLLVFVEVQVGVDALVLCVCVCVCLYSYVSTPGTRIQPMHDLFTLVIATLSSRPSSALHPARSPFPTAHSAVSESRVWRHSCLLTGWSVVASSTGFRVEAYNVGSMNRSRMRSCSVVPSALTGPRALRSVLRNAWRAEARRSVEMQSM